MFTTMIKLRRENPAAGSFKKNSPNPEALAELLKESGATDDEIQGFVTLLKRRNDPKRQLNSQLDETVTITMQTATDAQPGQREIRLLTAAGASNPLSFCIGTLPEQCANGQAGKTLDTATRVKLPAVLDGQILPGGVDHYTFDARRGARIVVAAQARALMPYIADAVPGWFQPVIAIYDPKGNEVAYADHFQFKPDPALSFEVPQDGVYLLEIRDALYRGREDFVYRATIGEVPYVTGIFPLGGRSGIPATVGLMDGISVARI